MEVKIPKMDEIITKKDTKRVVAPYFMLAKRAATKEDLVHVSEMFHKRLDRIFHTDFVDLTTVLHQSASILRSVTRSHSYAVYLVHEGCNEIYLVPTKINKDRLQVNWRIQTGTTAAAHCAALNECVLVSDIELDQRFPEGTGSPNTQIKSVICCPISTPEGSCLGVIELHREIYTKGYSEKDVRISVAMTGWIGVAVSQNQLKIIQSNKIKIHDFLLDLVKCCVKEDIPMLKIVAETIKLAKDCIKASRGKFYVVHPESEDLRSDVYEEGVEENSFYKKNVIVKLRKEDSVPGMVARQGSLICINDMKQFPNLATCLEDRVVKTKCTLVAPIMDGKRVIGILQMTNKVEPKQIFTKHDEEIIQIISKYCGLLLHYYTLKDNLTKNLYLDNIYLDLLERHMRPCRHEPDTFKDLEVPEEFQNFDWIIPEELHIQMPKYIVFMMRKVIGEEHLDNHILTQFVLTVKKVYRNHPFHNFEHGFAAIHTMYNILIRNPDCFSYVEKAALLIACLCHDIDHFGYTNDFLALTQGDFTGLYTDNIVENHNFQVTILVLKNFNMLNGLDQENYDEFCLEIKKNLLATNFSVYLKVKNKFKDVVTIDWDDSVHRDYMKQILMTASGCTIHIKDFVDAKQRLHDLYKEYYAQGEAQKSMGLIPIQMMDKEKIKLMPDIQVNFFEVICLPCLEYLKEQMPNTNDLHQEAKKLRECWLAIIGMRGYKHWKPFESVVCM